MQLKLNKNMMRNMVMMNNIEKRKYMLPLFGTLSELLNDKKQAV